MDRAGEGAAPAMTTSAVASARLQWKAPRLVRMGTVQALTSKKDQIGRNDGGTGTMKRT